MKVIFLAIILSQIQLIICQFDYTKCGKMSNNNADFVAGATNHPEDNPVGNWPWMASIGYHDESKKWNHQCGATLITDRHFLTAAHCANNIEWKIRIGDFNLESDSDDGNAEDLDIIEKFVHHKYDGVKSYFDIAIFKTKKITFTKAVSPVCLPQEINRDIHKYDNHLAELIGWGSSTTTGSVSNRLKRVSLKVFSQEDCNATHTPNSFSQRQPTIQAKLPQLFQDTVLCAGSDVGGQSSCRGDSGGPLMQLNRSYKSWIQFAIVQGSIGECGDIDYPGIYVRLDHSSIMAFITWTIGKSSGNQANIERGLTKLMISGGYTSSGITDQVEIIDLKSSSSRCHAPPNLPRGLYGTVGGLGIHNKPTICGGFDGSIYRECFFLDENEWIATNSMISPRKYASVSTSALYKMVVTGGHYNDDAYNTVEGLSEDGWKIISDNIPVKIDEHCSVSVNETTILIIGGNQNGEISSNTFFLNTETEEWWQGPQLKQPRKQHSCQRIRKDSNSLEMSIIVVGGWLGHTATSSVEILDPGANEWTRGPELPFTNDEAGLVEDGSGGVIIIGGLFGRNGIINGFSNTLYNLPHAGADAQWTEMEQKMKTERRTHLAFLIPDNFVRCF